MLRTSVPASSESAFETSVRETASNFIAGVSANSCFRRACDLLVHYERGDRQVPVLSVLFSRSERVNVHKLNHTLGVLK